MSHQHVDFTAKRRKLISFSVFISRTHRILIPMPRKRSKKGTDKEPVPANDVIDRFMPFLENSNFSCGGGITAAVNLSFKGPDNAFYHLEFPNPNQKQLDLLKSVCEQATYGEGSKDVLNKSYRNALVLPPARFYSSFHPSDFNIIQNILFNKFCVPVFS